MPYVRPMRWLPGYWGPHVGKPPICQDCAYSLEQLPGSPSPLSWPLCLQALGCPLAWLVAERAKSSELLNLSCLWK